MARSEDLAKLNEGVEAWNQRQMKNANLLAANLKGAHLEMANLEGAKLQGAKLPISNVLNHWYSEYRSSLDTIYTSLTFADAVKARGVPSAIAICATFSLLLIQTWKQVRHVYPHLAMALTSEAYAQAAVTATPARAFTPPLGLPQDIYNIVILVLLLILLLIIGALVWAGCLAKSKNVRAAALVEHFSTFLLGAFLGTKIQ
jgi:hypothetical protein